MLKLRVISLLYISSLETNCSQSQLCLSCQLQQDMEGLFYCSSPPEREACPPKRVCYSVSPECKALQTHSASLVTAIANPLRLSWALFAKEVIDEATRERASKGNLIVLEKNDILLAAISRRVEADPSLFRRLVDILKEDGDSPLKSLGGKLETTYSK